MYLAITDLDEGKIVSAANRLSSPGLAAPGSRAWLMSQNLLGRIALLEGKPRGAVRFANAMLATPEPDRMPVDLLHAGLLCADAGDLVRAGDVLSRLNNNASENPSPWATRFVQELTGEIAMAEGNPARAIASFRRAMAALPDPALHRPLAQAYQREGQWDLALQEWGQVVAARGAFLQNEFPPDLMLAHLNIARLLQSRGDLRGAEENYRKVLDQCTNADPNSYRPAAAQELRRLTKPHTDSVGSLSIPEPTGRTIARFLSRPERPSPE